MSQVFGFALLRNGVKYDYPFRESLRSLAGLVDETVLALGDSEDSTEAELAAVPRLHIVPTKWDEELRKGGMILSQQTNVALGELRRRHKSGWAFYLQSDEVLLESEIPQIKQDLAQAEAEGCDAVSFRYLHFWQRYDRIAIGARWYPQEIRAIRLDSSAESYGDAQSFRGWKKVFYSDAHIFHYGHVRRAEAYEQKKRDFHKWWHSDKEIAKVLREGEVQDKSEETLAYFGPHPAVMKERLKSLPGSFGEPAKNLWVYGKELRQHPAIHFTLDLHEIFQHRPEEVALLESLPFWKRITHPKFRTQVPKSMKSPNARPWTKEFRLVLLLSEKGLRL